MTNDKGSKMHGGLIRKDKRVVKDQNGHTTTQHWDGRKDVNIDARSIRTFGGTKNPGGES
jgi:DNA polymerase/3'-5' exonuclease PolX